MAGKSSGSAGDPFQMFLAQVRNLGTPNLNNASWTDIPVNGIQDFLEDGFALSGSGIVCNFDGLVRASGHIDYTTVGQRVALKLRLAIDQTGQPAEGKTGYVRAASGHNEATVSLLPRWIQVTNGQVITLQTQRESTLTTTATAFAGQCMLLLERYG